MFQGEVILNVALIVDKICKTIFPRNLFCFRYIIANTLHKGDNKDDNNNNNNTKRIENAPYYMILSYVSRKTCAKQEESVYTQTHLNRRKEMGLEL